MRHNGIEYPGPRMYSRGQKMLTLPFRATENFIVIVSLHFRFPRRPKTRLTDGSPMNGVLERLYTFIIAMSLR
jgi:hypothetical protein